MGAVKLCVHKPVKTPFYIESTSVRLYSIEELAYYLYKNIYLIDERDIDEKLYCWIEMELGFTSLAEKLRGGKATGSHVYNQVMTILQASEYYSEAELSELSEKIKNISGMQTQERMKYKADELAQKGKYWEAIAEYDRILGIRQNSKLTVQFYAAVWNNLGACYAKMFLFEKAATCFESAHQFQKIAEYREKAYYARKLARYGQNGIEELQEPKLSAEFLEKAELVLKEIEEKIK